MSFVFSVKVVDDDIDISHLANATEEDLDKFNLDEDAPQIVGIIDDRPADLIAKEDYGTNSKWKTIGPTDNPNNDQRRTAEISRNNDGDGQRSFKRPADDSSRRIKRSKSPQQSKRSFDSSPRRRSKKSADPSPPRRRAEKDASPVRRRRRNSDESPPRRSRRSSDLSPPRRIKREKDASPPRRRRRSSDESPPRRSRRSSDLSPPRQIKRERDASPPRRRRKSSDRSPPRRSNKSSDLSPPRRIKVEKDSSPPRRRRKDSDESPPRRSRRSSDLSPPRQIKKERDASPPRRRRQSSDGSPARRTDLSPPRQTKRERDASPPRRRRRSSDESPPHHAKRNADLPTKLPKRSSDSPPPTHKKMMKTLDGKVAGLQSAQSLREENERFRKREDEMFKKLSENHPKDGEAVVRDRKTGKRRNFHEDAEREREKLKKEAERKEVYDRWGKGLKQIEDHKQRMATDTHEMNKPVARYADDEDLDDYLRGQCRDGDPMAEYFRRKAKEKDKGPGKYSENHKHFSNTCSKKNVRNVFVYFQRCPFIKDHFRKIGLTFVQDIDGMASIDRTATRRNGLKLKVRRRPPKKKHTNIALKICNPNLSCFILEQDRGKINKTKSL